MTKIVYRTTDPNGKIDVGMDPTNSINYFGSASDDFIARDFPWAERQSFTITRGIIWSSQEAIDAEVRRIERGFIEALGADDPTGLQSVAAFPPRRFGSMIRFPADHCGKAYHSPRGA